MMDRLADWRTMIERLADAGGLASRLRDLRASDDARKMAFVNEFRDDAGHRRAVDRPLLAWSLGVRLEPEREPDGRDLRMWWSLASGCSPLEIETTASGPLCPEAEILGIEVWTESELSALQALWWAGPKGTDRALAAAAWLMQELQPDNGTNHPWAVAVFVELACRGDAEALVYAETLLHNCQVQAGHADRFSALLLDDAARRLSSVS